MERPQNSFAFVLDTNICSRFRHDYILSRNYFTVFPGHLCNTNWITIASRRYPRAQGDRRRTNPDEVAPHGVSRCPGGRQQLGGQCRENRQQRHRSDTFRFIESRFFCRRDASRARAQHRFVLRNVGGACCNDCGDGTHKFFKKKENASCLSWASKLPSAGTLLPRVPATIHVSQGERWTTERNALQGVMITTQRLQLGLTKAIAPRHRNSQSWGGNAPHRQGRHGVCLWREHLPGPDRFTTPFGQHQP